MFYIETKNELRKATDSECQMINWHLEVGEELHLYGMNVYTEDFQEPSSVTENSIWSKCACFIQGYAKDGEEHMLPSWLFDKYQEASPERQELFMDWIHGKYVVPEELAYHMTGKEEALWVLNS